MNNNSSNYQGGSSSICLHFQNGQCRHNDNNRECQRKHIICSRGNNCNRTEGYCKFLHPYDTGFQKTCKETFVHCKFGRDCVFSQHPDKDLNHIIIKIVKEKNIVMK